MRITVPECEPGKKMGLIFDENSLGFYDAWRRSAQGRAIEGSLEKLFQSLVEPRPGQRVLDVGCGTGNHLLILNRLGLNISGTDASHAMVQKARKRLGHRSTLKQAMAEDLPFEDNEFDLVSLINALEFMDNPLQALREAGRVAGSKVFVGVLNSLSWNGILNRFHGYFNDPLFGQATFYNLWQIKSLMQLAYGPVPISWGCIKVVPGFVEDSRPSNKAFWNWKHSPFGFFLGLSATMVYTVRTENLPLKAKFKTASQALISARVRKEMDHARGVQKSERGLSVSEKRGK